jgi:hypothetical protein
MIALLDGAKPIAMEESVAAGLHPPIDEISTPEIVKPSLLLQIENWLVKAGIGVAQTTTTITYFLSLTVLVGIPMIAIIWVKKKRQNSSSSK